MLYPFNEKPQHVFDIGYQLTPCSHTGIILFTGTVVLYYSGQPALKSEARVAGITKAPDLGKYPEVRLIMSDVVAYLDWGEIRTATLQFKFADFLYVYNLREN